MDAAVGGIFCICSLDSAVTTFLMDNERFLYFLHKVFLYFVVIYKVRLFCLPNRVRKHFRRQLSLDDEFIFRTIDHKFETTC